ncbi:MAG: TrbG/VirB9 family P-type conjugative transfer protein [Rhodospirillaceae bacterium]|nr:TrbG/VirB9 family P-type conjugative transfer protein [Rhodospirillaceae bacterium]
MKHMSLVAIGAVIAIGVSIAASGAKADNRIKQVPYDADTIFSVPVRSGYQTTIEFSETEKVENVAVGDSAAWQVTPNKRGNLVFVKPVIPDSNTNMQVVTDRRTYAFDLVFSGAQKQGLYTLRFSYPAEPEAVPLKAEAPVAEAPAKAEEAPPAQVFNFGWKADGDKKLYPAHSFDDGRFLYLAWDAEADIPAILSVGPDGKEGPVNYTSKGDYIVVDAAVRNLVFRSGKKSATLTQTRTQTAAAKD